MTAALSCLLPLAAILAYRCGIRDGKALQNGKALPQDHGALPRKTGLPQGYVEQADPRLDTLLYNIDHYDGTEAKQREL